MKIRYYSDIHVEFGRVPDLSCPDAQTVIVLAGDIHTKGRGFSWARATWPRNEIVYVLGNHEFYGGEYHAVRRDARLAADQFAIHLLDPGMVVIGNVRFVGCTLWTDMNLRGDRWAAGLEADSCMRDFTGGIRMLRGNQYSRLRAADTARFHHEELRFLERELVSPFIGKTIVVTHHAPHRRASDPCHDNSPLQPAYCSDLMRLLAPPIDLWISGHTHWTSAITFESGTRWASNQAGYPDENDVRTSFSPDAEIDLDNQRSNDILATDAKELSFTASMAPFMVSTNARLDLPESPDVDEHLEIGNFKPDTPPAMPHEKPDGKDS